jgi:putative ABC transport system permease protein
MGTFRYNLGSLLSRKTLSLCVAMSIMVAVFVTAGTSMLMRGIRKLFVGHAAPTSVIVLSKGSEMEFGGMISATSRNALLALPQVRRGPDGVPDASAEAMQLLNLQRTDGSGGTNVVVRGITEAGLRLRPRVHVLAGRLHRVGTDEGMVGAKLLGRVAGLEIGKELIFSNTQSLKIVGVFEDSGSATESEVLANLDFVQTAFGASGFVSSVHLELRSPADFDGLRASATEKPINLSALRLREFEEKQAGSLTVLVSFLGGALGTLLTLAAILGAFVGMHGSINARVREFGTMRALGFPSGMILRGVLMEATMLAFVGASAGTIAALALAPVQLTLMGPNWASVVLRFEPSLFAFAAAAANAIVIGLAGAAIPAIQALRIAPTEALRSA